MVAFGIIDQVYGYSLTWAASSVSTGMGYIVVINMSQPCMSHHWKIFKSRHARADYGTPINIKCEGGNMMMTIINLYH